MPATTKSYKKYQGTKTALKTNTEGRLIVESIDAPHAGSGACKVTGCTCKKFVYARNRFNVITSHTFVECDNCGHKEKDHA